MQEVIQSSKETKEFLALVINTAWNSFYEDIWKRRCEAFVLWEKELGIDTKEKKWKKNIISKQVVLEKGNLTSYEESSNRIEKNQASVKAKQERKEVEIREIQETWFCSIVNFICNKSRPFAYGLIG